MTEELKKQQIKEFLNNLENPYEYLMRGSYKGEPENPNACPLARCLQYEFDYTKEELRVLNFWLYVGKEDKYETPKTQIKLPDNLREFIKDFDDGYYPALIEEHALGTLITI